MEDGQGCRQSSYLTAEPLEGREGGSGVGTPHGGPGGGTHPPAGSSSSSDAALSPVQRRDGVVGSCCLSPTHYSHRGTGDPLQSITELATPGRELPATRISGDLGITERALQR